MEVAAIVPAAGTGIRMRSKRPKQFMALEGVPILVRALQVLEKSPLIEAVIPVVPYEYIDFAHKMISVRWKLKKCLFPIAGGSRRQDSVKLGFEKLPLAEIVLIHDGARPFINQDIISRCIRAAMVDGAAVCAVQPSETVKFSDDGKRIAKTLDRHKIWLAQTPQAFRHSILSDAYGKIEPKEEFTDEGALVESAGYPVTIVEGIPENIKITSPEDMTTGRAQLQNSAISGRR